MSKLLFKKPRRSLLKKLLTRTREDTFEDLCFPSHDPKRLKLEERYLRGIDVYLDIQGNLNGASAQAVYGCGKKYCEVGRKLLDLNSGPEPVNPEILEGITQETLASKKDIAQFSINTPWNSFIEQDAKIDLSEKLDPAIYSYGINCLINKYS